jgi:peroxiredoxin
VPGAAAEAAGVAADDILLKFDGKALNTVAALQGLAAATKPGTKVQLDVLRNNKPLAIAVTMGSRREFEKTTVESSIGKQAPNFSGKDSKSGKIVQLSDFKGKPVLIEMWATWCPTCRSNIPTLNAYQSKYKSKGLTILAVSQEEEQEVTKFQKTTAMEYISLLAGDAALPREYWTNAIPTFIYINPKGVIEKVSVGDEGLPAIAHAIEKL